jgi:hypothetical protein
MSQEIIFTTLPNQLIEADGKQWLQLSVFVSIRLTSVKDTTLNSFDDILKWPEKILNSKWQFRLQSGTVTEGELNKQKIDFELFKNVFHKDIRVKGFMQEDLSLKRINSFPMVHIHNFLVKNFLQTAIENPKEKLTADNFIDEERFGAISRFKLNEEEISRMDNIQRMRTPLKFQNLLISRSEPEQDHKIVLRANHFVPFATKINPKSDFEQFHSFHKTAKEPKHKVPLRIKKPEFEFHDIMAVINNYPQLMRKFGFVLDFQIPYSNVIPVEGTIHIIPVSLGLSDDSSTISTPPVAY